MEILENNNPVIEHPDMHTEVADSVTQDAPSASVEETAVPETAPRGWFRTPAEVISWLSVPLLCPVYGVIMAFYLSMLKFLPISTKVVYIGYTFFITGFLPIFAFAVLKWFGMISDIGLNERKERFIPYIITMVCMAGAAYLFYAKGSPLWLVMFFIGGVATAIIEMVVNRWWKISAHAAGMAGLVALLVRMTKISLININLTWWIVVMIMICGLVCTCRLYLQRHTLLQVLAGSVCGYTCVYLCMLIN